MNRFSKISQHPVYLFIKPILTILLLLIGHYVVSAQQESDQLLAYAPTEANSTTSWKFLIGAKKMYYIDFDEVQPKIENILLKSLNGEVVFEDNVKDLSRKTFYELNLKKIKNGSYYLVLETQHKTMKKLLELK